MPRFKKKSLIIEPIQWTGHNIEAVVEFVGSLGFHGRLGADVVVKTTGGDLVPVHPNDWIVPDSKPHTFYPINPEVMDATYDRLPD